MQIAFDPAQAIAGLLGLLRHGAKQVFEHLVGTARELARSYGVESRCAGVHACDIAVLDLETDPAAYKTILESCRTALERDRSEVVVLRSVREVCLVQALLVQRSAR